MASDKPLQGKIAIVTGASRGIGTAIAELLASRGANVVIGYTSSKSADSAKELAAKLAQQHGGNHLPIQADLADASASQHLVDEAKRHYSQSNNDFLISIIVNNAGIAMLDALGNIDEPAFTQSYRTNVLGPLLLVQAALPHLPRDRSGRIVNVSSTSSALGVQGQSVYAGTKGALEAMTKVWARELSERATVNAINPGPVATEMLLAQGREFQEGLAPLIDMTPLARMSEERDGRDAMRQWEAMHGRPATLREVAGIVGMLCSADSAWCTGSTICANGGMKFTA